MQVEDDDPERVQRAEERQSIARRICAFKRSFFLPRAPIPFLEPPPQKKQGEPRILPLATSSSREFLKLRRSIPFPDAPPLPSVSDDEDDDVLPRRARALRTGWAQHRVHRERQQALRQRKREELRQWNPFADPKIQGDSRCCALVAGLPPNFTSEALRQFGDKFGKVVSVRCVKGRDGFSRPYGFIQFDKPKELQKAVTQQSAVYQGKRLRIYFEQARTNSSFRPKRLRGISTAEKK